LLVISGKLAEKGESAVRGDHQQAADVALVQDVSPGIDGVMNTTAFSVLQQDNVFPAHYA